jgi:predicted Zn-dependent peptidase
MYHKTKLKNGLTLITSAQKDTKAVTVLVLLPVGSRHETKNINGVSHFIEHLMFKGTTNRPTSLDISKELDSVGASYNAFTSKDHTGYYVKLAANKIELAFDLMADMLFNSLFDPDEIKRERGVIIEEINMYEDNPMFYLGSLFEQTIYGSHPLGWLISGPKKVIKKVSREAILNYKKKYYNPANMVLTVAGNFKKDKVNKLAQKYFGNNQDKSQLPSFAKLKIKQARPKLNIKYKKTQQIHMALGFPSFSINDHKLYPLYLLAVILGGNMSSRLFTEVREKRGLAYYIKTDISSYQDTGAFLVQAGLDKSRIKEAIQVILAELKKIKDQGVTGKELKSAQEFIKGKIILELEDSENIADWYSKQELFLDKILTPEQRMKKISAVTKDQVKKIAQQVIDERKINLAMIGPVKDKSTLKKLLKF